MYAIDIICSRHMYGLYETYIQRYARVCDRGKEKTKAKTFNEIVWSSLPLSSSSLLSDAEDER